MKRSHTLTSSHPPTRVPMTLTGALLVCAALSACSWIPPRPAQNGLSSQAPVADSLAANGDWPSASWWLAYDDPQLTDLITRAERTAPSIDAAHARFAAAQASVRAAAAATGLQVNLDGDASRQRLSDNGLIPPRLLGFYWYNQSDLGLNIGYSFDWWGKQRAQLSAALDARRAAQAERTAASLTLSTAVAEVYFGWQSDQSRLQIASARLANLQQQRQLAQRRVDADIARIDEVTQLDAAAAAATEQRTQVVNSARLRLVALAALLSVKPDELPSLKPTALPQRRTTLPANASLDLLARRPDIDASRWRVEAATRSVDVARAGFFPDVSLRALAGLSSITFGKLFEAGSAVPQVTAAIHLPLFDSGLLRAQYAGSQAQLRAAIAAYNDTLVNAAREVNTQALTLDDLATRRQQRQQQLDLTQRLGALAESRAQAGISDERPVLLAQAQLIEQQDAIAALDGAAWQSNVELVRALGGGYQRDVSTTAGVQPAGKLNP